MVYLNFYLLFLNIIMKKNKYIFNKFFGNLIELESLYLTSLDPIHLFNFKLNATSLKGYKHTKEALDLMSLINKGENHPMFGLKHTEETKEKIRNKMLGDKNPRFGVNLS